jgi:hypothetical protein
VNADPGHSIERLDGAFGSTQRHRAFTGGDERGGQFDCVGRGPASVGEPIDQPLLPCPEDGSDALDRDKQIAVVRQLTHRWPAPLPHGSGT